MLDDFRYIFVVTYGRSGSTLLMKLLNQNTGVDIKGENFNALYHVFQSVRSARDAQVTHGRQNESSESPWYGASQMNLAAYQRSLLDGFVREVLAPKPGTDVTGFKEIRYLDKHMSDDEFHDFMTFLIEAFPDSRILFNTRAADSVAKSGWFRDQDPETVVQMISHADRRFQEFAATHERAHIIDYAETTQNGPELANAFAFLDLKPDPQMISSVLTKKLMHNQGKPGFLRKAARRVTRILAKSR